MVVLSLVFWVIFILFFIVAAQIYILNSHAQWFAFCPPSHQHLLFLVFLIPAILTEVIISLWFWFAFPCWLMMLTFFMCLLAICMSSLKNACLDSLCIFNPAIFFWPWVLWVLYTFRVPTPYQKYHWQISSPNQRYFFVLLAVSFADQKVF